MATKTKYYLPSQLTKVFAIDNRGMKGKAKNVQICVTLLLPKDLRSKRSEAVKKTFDYYGA
jgi:hypothetical protein